MVTGRKAFEGKSHASLISSIMSSDPPQLSTLQPLTPPALDHIVRRCLAKDPDERWQTARDLMRELKWIAEAAVQMAVPTPSVLQRKGLFGSARLTWSLFVVALVVALALTTVMYLAARPLTRASIAARFWQPSRPIPTPRRYCRFPPMAISSHSSGRMPTATSWCTCAHSCLPACLARLAHRSGRHAAG
jgi:serine/threonine protein kinase